MNKMNTIRRIECLLSKTSPSPTPAVHSFSNLHAILDVVDKRLGIITRHGRHNVYGLEEDRPIVHEYVGARLRRLENHLGYERKAA